MSTLTVIFLVAWWLAVGRWIHHMWVKCHGKLDNSCEHIIMVTCWPGVALLLLLELMYIHITRKKQ